LGIYRTISIKKIANITLWKITESEDDLYLLCDDIVIKEKALSIKPITQRKQFLATQLLLKKLNLKGLLKKDLNGKPYLSNGNHISISHDSEYVAIMVSENACGIDLQSFSPKVLKIKHKFIHIDDYCALSNDINELTLAWSTKEALYKINGDPMVYFKEHLRLISNNQKNQVIEAAIHHENYSQKVNLRYRKLDDLFLVYTIA
jgi:4'-phosphopantetheinyl transferase